MSPEFWLPWFPRIAWLQAALFVSGGWFLFRASGRTIAEAALYALMTGCLFFRLSVQSSLLLQNLWPLWLIHALGNLAALYALYRHRRLFAESVAFSIGFFRQHPVTLIMAAGGILFRCFLSSVKTPGWFPFAVSERFLSAPAAGGSHLNVWIQATLMPVDLMAYLAIGFGVYALSRRHAWPPAALSAMITALSLARWAHPPMASAFEMEITAAGLLALTALYRFLEHPSSDDGLILGIAVIGCSSDFPMGWLFPSVMTGLSLLLIQRRHGWHHLIDLILRRKWMVLLCIGFLGVSMPLWRHHGGDFIEQDVMVMHENRDGVRGAIQNAVRYGFQAAYIEPVRHAGLQPAGELWKSLLEKAYGSVCRMLRVGKDPMPWMTSGYGPLILFLVLPSWAYSLAKASRRLRSVAIAMVFYAALLCLIPAWNPEYLYLLSPMIAVCCIMIACFLPPWRFTKAGQRLFHLVCLLIWAYSLADVALLP